MTRWPRHGAGDRPSATGATASRPGPVHDVGRGAGEPERLVEPDRRRVRLLDIQHDLGQPPVPQVTQADQGQGPAQPGALLGRVDPEHVDLTHRPAAGAPGGVDLGPVETGQPPAAHGEEEPARIEPRLTLAAVDILPGPLALLRVVSEGTAVEREPLRLVLAG